MGSFERLFLDNRMFELMRGHKEGLMCDDRRKELGKARLTGP